MVKSHQPRLKALEMTAQIHWQRCSLNSAGKTIRTRQMNNSSASLASGGGGYG